MNSLKDFDVNVAILGAGTAGMAAYREASKHTESIALIDGGPLGTTCARVGCNRLNYIGSGEVSVSAASSILKADIIPLRAIMNCKL